MAVAGAPKAFFSYVRHVDEHDTGRLTRLRERLQGEIRVQTGLAIEIYQDVSALQWGDRWEEHVARAAAGSLFLIPVVTPGYFQSEPCRKEYEAFRKMQKRHGIAGMVLPIYYVETEELSDRSSTKTGYHAVSIRTGRLQLEGCDLSCAGLACVAISDDADPIVRRNRIHGGGKGGVLVSKGARGTIEDNDIFANTLAGIEIREEANPSIKRNRIRDSKGFGVLVQKRGRGIIEDNEVLSNTMFGFLIQSEADPCVRRNRIHTNRFEGVCVRTHGRGTFEDNDFRDNVRGAWDIAADCRHNVRRSGNIEK